MTEKELADERRRLLTLEIAEQGLSSIAVRLKKPSSQILDMATGRKSFGDGAARIMGPIIRPDLPRDWLIFADSHEKATQMTGQADSEDRNRADNVSRLNPINPLVKELVTVAESISDRGIAELIGRAKEVFLQHPRANPSKGKLQ